MQPIKTLRIEHSQLQQKVRALLKKRPFTREDALLLAVMLDQLRAAYVALGLAELGQQLKKLEDTLPSLRALTPAVAAGMTEAVIIMPATVLPVLQAITLHLAAIDEIMAAVAEPQQGRAGRGAIGSGTPRLGM